MSEAIAGQVVCVRQGRGKGRFYVVLGTDRAGWYLLANGSDRPLVNPKRKNPLHVRKTRVRLTIDGFQTDKQLQAALRSILHILFS